VAVCCCEGVDEGVGEVMAAGAAAGSDCVGVEGGAIDDAREIFEDVTHCVLIGSSRKNGTNSIIRKKNAERRCLN
jgi:hypothetical protein